jgi:chromodomain-helicase-DNA-binding protein 7
MLDFSSKMIVLDKLVTKYKKEHKKILIFSQFTEMLKIIQEFLTYKKILYKKIDGGVKPKDRENAIESFNSNKGMFEVFLLSTKAGGLGINLTSANVVIIYDSDWNPQNDVQAIARAHRIGQTEEVKVYRLISKKTYEAQMYERASKKLGLDQAVFMVGDDNPQQNGKYKFS